ncbi:hypothetical protein [Brevibacillus antibioticus]|uniref:hypothetical protein n=1 Tax=Brevibacillus antibioticus TaxID=2570228 RepID=UPI001FCA6037|nr:hypothetical protein [Brevibacillus antibioticus]
MVTITTYQKKKGNPLWFYWQSVRLSSLGVLFVIYTGAELHFDVRILWIVLTMLTFAPSIILVWLLGHRLPPLVMTLVSNLIGVGSMLPFVLISIPTATVKRRSSPRFHLSKAVRRIFHSKTVGIVVEKYNFLALY